MTQTRYGSCTYAPIRTSSPILAHLEPCELGRPGEPGEHSRTLAREPRRLEDEQLVEKIVLHERGRERGATLEEQGLDTVRG